MIFLTGLFVGVLLGIILMSLLYTNKSDGLTEAHLMGIDKLAVQAKLVGAIYSIRLYNMANNFLANKPIKDEIKCPVCKALYFECNCGLCKEKE